MPVDNNPTGIVESETGRAFGARHLQTLKPKRRNNPIRFESELRAGPNPERLASSSIDCAWLSTNGPQGVNAPLHIAQNFNRVSAKNELNTFLYRAAKFLPSTR